MRKLFGTDGIRGEAGIAPLDAPTLYRLGWALGRALADGSPARVCIGRDTRESGPMIERALAAGIARAGGSAVSAGVLPTPALALVTRQGEFSAGLMVSASHNPFEDNGVKVFDEHGTKLPDEVESEIEARMATCPEVPALADEDGEIDAHEALQESYLDFLLSTLGEIRLDGLHVVLDLAHGAAYRLAPEAFRRAGARVTTLADAPDGRNINDGVGSMHPEVVAEAVVRENADLGFAFDGDADRCIGASRRGRVLDGDFILYYAACALHRERRLPGATVVATVMSNLGLQKALEREGLRMERTAVGDRYVLAAMREQGFALGGEQSGHVIFMEHAPTGDGTLTALQLALHAAKGAGAPDEVADRIPHFPQLLRNIRVTHKPAIDEHPVLGPAVEAARRRLGADGRVVVRYSGTEPKARVMIEAADAATVEELVGELVSLFEREIGA